MAGTTPPGPRDDDVKSGSWRYDPDGLPARFDVWGRPPAEDEQPGPTAAGPTSSGAHTPSGDTSPAGRAWNAFAPVTPPQDAPRWGEAPASAPPARSWDDNLPPATDPWIDQTSDEATDEDWTALLRGDQSTSYAPDSPMSFAAPQPYDAYDPYADPRSPEYARAHNGGQDNDRGVEYDGYDASQGAEADGGSAGYESEESYDPAQPYEASGAPHGYGEPGYAEQGYAEQGYAQQGYAEQEYAEETYSGPALDEHSYGPQGYSEPGDGEQGFRKQGYGEQGYSERGNGDPGYGEGFLDDSPAFVVPPLSALPPLGAGGGRAGGSLSFPAQVFPANPDSYDHEDEPASPGAWRHDSVPKPPPWPPERRSRLTSWEESLSDGEPHGDGSHEPPRSRRGGLKLAGAALVIVLLAAIGVMVKGGAGRLFQNGAAANPNATTPTQDRAGGPPPANPFAGTPAAEFQQGDAGITLPAATAVPGFTVEQVQAALAQVKQGLVASRLDPAMLVSHDNGPLLTLLSPQAGKELAPYFATQKFFGFATQLAPGNSLTADKVRVKGQMTFKGNTVAGVRLLEVVTNYVWVYPFAGKLETAGDHLVIVHDQVNWAVPVESDVDKDYRGLRISGWDGFASNMDCELLKQSLLALGKPKLVSATTQADSDAAYDPTQSLKVTSTC